MVCREVIYIHKYEHNKHFIRYNLIKHFSHNPILSFQPQKNALVTSPNEFVQVVTRNTSQLSNDYTLSTYINTALQ